MTKPYIGEQFLEHVKCYFSNLTNVIQILDVKISQMKIFFSRFRGLSLFIYALT